MRDERTVSIRPLAKGFLVRAEWAAPEDHVFHEEEEFCSTLPKALKVIKRFFKPQVDGNVLPF